MKFLWKWLFCRWFHDKHRCFPEVNDRGLDGPWHCAECHPCGEGIFDELPISPQMSSKKLRAMAEHIRKLW